MYIHSEGILLTTLPTHVAATQSHKQKGVLPMSPRRDESHPKTNTQRRQWSHLTTPPPWLPLREAEKGWPTEQQHLRESFED